MIKDNLYDYRDIPPSTHAWQAVFQEEDLFFPEPEKLSTVGAMQVELNEYGLSCCKEISATCANCPYGEFEEF